LRAVFHNPDELRSGRTRAKLTREAADKFQTISDSLQHRNPDREAVAHFINQLVFCFFANSVGLLPNGLWRKLLETAGRRPERANAFLEKLFKEMVTGGEFDLEDIAPFNGGLFDGRGPLALAHTEIALLFAAASMDWGLIDPTIFGTLFERFLDPDKRAQIGAHYTDPEKIMLIIEPVVVRPLGREWQVAKAQIEAIMAPVLAASGGSGKAASRDLSKRFNVARAKAEGERDAFIDRLCALRILDPACGSGNFLYLALQAVKDIEYRAILECETIGLGMVVPRVGPEILHGIEINPFAAELARTTIWIGDIQWRVKNAITHHPRPILRKLDTIECRDALLAPDDRGGFVEAEWPAVDYIVGNPPFLGGKLMRRGLGDVNVEALFRTYAGRVPAEADLVCYWFAKAWEALRSDQAKRVGLVSTNSIRGGANRKVLEPIAEAGAIFEAWSDEAWTVEGAAVRVSFVCFGAGDAHSDGRQHTLDGLLATQINSDLTGVAANLLKAASLAENQNVAFQGPVKVGPFDISEAIARSWLRQPLNPNRRPNADVLFPWLNGSDLVRRSHEKWIIDFGDLDEGAASLFEAPFEYVAREIAPIRRENRDRQRRESWWRLGRSGDDVKRAIAKLSRAMFTPRVAKHRLFVWVDSLTLPDSAVVAIARDDDTTFGILHSRFHETWSLHLGTSLEDRPRYTPTTTFETFPFPEGLSPNIPAADYAADPRAIRIAAAAKKLDDLRRA
jgi:type II restriction/modification system DNA methylase subunit YeeA